MAGTENSTTGVYSWDLEEFEILVKNANSHYNSVSDVLTQYNTLMERLTSAWEGQASEAHMTEMTKTLGEFKNFLTELEEFKEALNQIKEIYADTEAYINTNISTLADEINSTAINSVV